MQDSLSPGTVNTFGFPFRFFIISKRSFLSACPENSNCLTSAVSSRGPDMKVTAEVRQFEFSGHADRNDLFEMIKNLKGNPKVLTVHGDNESCIKFAEEIHERFGLEAYSPQVNETISV